MRLKLLAPVRTEFSIVSEAPILESGRYAAFWDTVAEHSPALRARLSAALRPSEHDGVIQLRFPHRPAYCLDPFNRYQSLEGDSLERPLHVLEVHLDHPAAGAHLPPDVSALLKRSNLYVEQITWRVFDYGISLLEVDIHLGEVLDAVTSEQIPAVLNDLQQTGVRVGERLAAHGAERLLRPLFDELYDIAGSTDFIESDPAPHGPDANGKVLWVTRTLIFDAESDAHPPVIRHWLKDVGLTGGERDALETPADEHRESLIDRLIHDDTQHLMRWLNYLFRERAYPAEATYPGTRSRLVKPFCDAWEAMLHAQFYYGALDLVDLRLTRILAQSLTPDSSLQVDQLKAVLEQNIRKANLLLVQFHDSSKYYKRTVKSELDDILAHWDFERVLIEPVKDKIKLCEERLTLLHRKEAARSAIYTDVILLGIGITSIFGTSLALAEYGRTMANDADLGSYDVNSANFIEGFAALPTDVILVGAFVLSLLLGVLYAHYRKRQTP